MNTDYVGRHRKPEPAPALTAAPFLPDGRIDFKALGFVGPDGFQLKSNDRQIPTWGGNVLPAQQKRTMKFSVKLDTFKPDMLAALFGPQFALAYAFKAIDPHWYLNGAHR